MIPPSTLAAWRKLAEEATSGPWSRHDDICSTGPVSDHGLASTGASCTHADIQFVAAARTAVPALIEEVEELQSQVAVVVQASNAQLVEHSELSGHIDVAEQCRDYLAHEADDDPSGKLQDFVESLRVVIDQLDRQRRSRNWYEVAYTAGKQNLIEHALSKVCCKGEPHTCDQEAIAAAEGKTDRAILELSALRTELARVMTERDAYRSMVCDLLASAHPHPTEHPTMTKQWARAREMLKHGPATIDAAKAKERGG